MNDAGRTVGFGAPERADAHRFRVHIPAVRHAEVVVSELFAAARPDELPEPEERVRLVRPVWAAIRDCARAVFNERLKSRKLPTGKWAQGDVYLDRLLGRELCVLAWAAEHAADDHTQRVICAKWEALRPEERWWLYAQTCAEAGRPEDRERGWRKALFYALSDGDGPRPGGRSAPKDDGLLGQIAEQAEQTALQQPTRRRFGDSSVQAVSLFDAAEEPRPNQ